MEQPVLRAVRDRAVCMVNPFRCKLLHKKASLAVLSDERNAGLFDDERAARHRRPHPLDPQWSRNGGPSFDGQPVDLVPFVVAHRASGSCSSRTTTTAATASCSAGRWTTPRGRRPSRTALAAALHRAGADRAPVRAVSQPGRRQGQVRRRMLDTAPFVCSRRVRGRLPDAALDRRAAQRHRRRRLDGADVHGGEAKP